MTNNSLIFLTDKRGRHNRTSEIESISYDNAKNIWLIKFYNSSQTFHYKDENIEIIKNSLSDERSQKVFSYLIRMAEFCDLKIEDGGNLLIKFLEKLSFIHEDSVLARYLNPERKVKKKRKSDTPLIFPFGCNSSQFEAVSTALKSSISIVQGPPGTGKTQTILNIIANLLMSDKSVLIVSNNNSATLNVFEKLSSEKYGMGFICAALGNKENIADFLKNQKSTYPEYLKDWQEGKETNLYELSEEMKKLKKYFEATERISIIKSELSALQLEEKHFSHSENPKYESKKLFKKHSSKVMKILQKLKEAYSAKEELTYFQKLNLRFAYGVGERKFWLTDAEKAFDTLKYAYYTLKRRELEAELGHIELIKKQVDPSNVYDKSLNALSFKLAQRFLSKGSRHRFESQKEIRSNASLVISEYPVILSTTFSSIKAKGDNEEFLFDYLIMDEASQVDIVTGALALSCAKNAVIVGDKMQLPNVIKGNKKREAIDIFVKTNLPEGYNFIHSFLASLEMVLPETPSTLLKEHYRCHPKIINFCNEQFYGGKLLIMKEDKGEVDVLTAIKTGVGRFSKDHYNQRQIDIIKEDILSKYSKSEIENLGIIAPYNNQVNAIKRDIEKVDVATVHKFQGREKDNIIISTTDDEITDFVDDSNMLNVAISRAKKRLAIVLSGNAQRENTNLVSLLKYIEYNNCTVRESKVSSVFDFFYARASKAKWEYLKSVKKISKFDSENIMNSLLEKIFSEDKYSRFSFVFQMPLREVVDRNYLKEMPEELRLFAMRSWAHVDFAVYNKVTKEILFGIEVDGYSYHKEGTLQAERDWKKNEIFKLIGLPLLRLNTRGSNEEERIRTLVKSYL